MDGRQHAIALCRLLLFLLGCLLLFVFAVWFACLCASDVLLFCSCFFLSNKIPPMYVMQVFGQTFSGSCYDETLFLGRSRQSTACTRVRGAARPDVHVLVRDGVLLAQVQPHPACGEPFPAGHRRGRDVRPHDPVQVDPADAASRSNQPRVSMKPIISMMIHML